MTATYGGLNPDAEAEQVHYENNTSDMLCQVVHPDGI